PAGEAFSPACFVMPFFSRAIFAGLFLFQLLTFVCRTPYIYPYLSIVNQSSVQPHTRPDLDRRGIPSLKSRSVVTTYRVLPSVFPAKQHLFPSEIDSAGQVHSTDTIIPVFFALFNRFFKVFW
ncbi:hypothetical protein, partial [Flavonifractor sp. AGMB03687]|uniref:hypothetical protein n=1 Tax=Flavonifractor sp. AGMB03687 TaxID=2785133 RepID=UPI001AE03596